MNVAGLVFVIFFAMFIVVFTVLAGRKGARPAVFREIEAFHSLPETVGQAVETGRRLHVSLGSGSIGGPDTAAALAGLTVLDQVSAVATVSDKPPVVTTADGLAAMLARDTLKQVYTRQNAFQRYDPASARVAGLTPLAFSAALSTMLKDESVAGTILVGSVGPEAVLFTEAGTRANITTLAGSDDPAAQATLFAASDHPLIGEDLYAGGGYIGRVPMHVASLRTQDVFRLLIGLAILAGVVLKTLRIPLP